tara:strand:- start:114 stop:539 length:426 start_codon:yes stop_codon:yes gene_type:complete
MDFAQKGDIVIIHYTISFLNGKVFDTTKNKDPLKFKLGNKIFISGLEETIEGMFIGQTIKKTIPESKGFGPKQEKLIQKFPLKDIPDHIIKRKGQRIQIETTPPLQATITDITDDYVVLDSNPLQAGQKLNIEVQLIDIIR